MNKTIQMRPLADVLEDSHALTIVADIPGVEKENLSISVENNVLTLLGKCFSEEEIEENNQQSQRYYERKFQIGSDIDSEKITASISQGVVSLTLPKIPKAEPRKIPINHN